MNPADLFKTFPGFPILLSVLLLLPVTARAWPGPRAAQLGLRLVGVAVGATATLALLLAFANLLVPDYVDNVEPTVVGDAWIWWHGGQLYPSIAAQAGDAGPELRGLLYGPLTFLLAGIAPMLGGPSVLVTKLPPVGLFLAMVALTGLACRRAGAPWRTALLATAAMTTVLGISEAPYWVRGDTVLMLIGAVCAWLAARPAPRPLACAVLLGVLAGSASAVKLHGGAYVAPACLMVVLNAAGWPAGDARPVDWRRGVRVAVLIGVAALAAAAWPFLLRGITLDGYAFYLGLAAHHGFSARLLLGNLTLLLGVCLPILVLAVDGPAGLPRPMLVLAGAAFACAVLVAFIASKPGAGYPHLLPFMPYAALVLSQVLARRPARALAGPGVPFRLLAVGVLFCVAFCLPVLVRAATFAARGAAFATIRAGSRQIQDVMQRHPGEVVAVGYGGASFLDLRLSYLRVLPVFGGDPLLYDATAMDDLWQGGADRMMALRQIDKCGVRIWLIPGDEPFTIENFYGGFTFSEAFRARFAARYALAPSDGPFRMWVCTMPR